MKATFLLITAILFPIFVPAASMSHNPYPFNNQIQEERFNHLSHEFRCLVCQNQSLADSNADLAKDLRHRLYELVLQEKTNEQIRDYFVQRYGDFIRYSPPFKGNTIILWGLPFFLLMLGFLIVMIIIYKQQKSRDDD